MARVVFSVTTRFKRRTRHCLLSCLKQCRFVQPLDGLDAGGGAPSDVRAAGTFVGASGRWPAQPVLADLGGNIGKNFGSIRHLQVQRVMVLVGRALRHGVRWVSPFGGDDLWQVFAARSHHAHVAQRIKLGLIN